MRSTKRVKSEERRVKVGAASRVWALLMAVLVLVGVSMLAACESTASAKGNQRGPYVVQSAGRDHWYGPSASDIDEATLDFEARGANTSVGGRALQAHPGQRAGMNIYGWVEGGYTFDRKKDEVVVIEKGVGGKDLAIPGGGALEAEVGGKMVVVPLRHTEVSAEVSGFVASVGVTQQFENPYSEKIEATYVFPLPQDAGVNDFVMTIGERHIRGIIREREEARKIYEAAKHQGYVASLMTQERPNIFTQNVANIEPGKRIDVSIRYFHTLTYTDGWYEFVFPMVVGPRFNPPGFSDGVGAVAKGDRAASGQKTEVQYLRPTERSGHDIGLTVKVDAGVAIEDVACVNHAVTRHDEGEGKMVVELDPRDTIPNKDFVLRWKVAGKKVKTGMVVQRDQDGKGGYFAMMLFPPEDASSLPRKPLEMVFTVDVSGSQAGAPLAQEKAAVRWALTHMNGGDTFQVIRFGNTARRHFAAPVPANGENVRDALQWVDGFDAREGTMLVDGLRASLLFPHDAERLRFVTFLTDGFIGNESEALAEIQKDLGPSRIFSFGVGSSTNRYLLDHMAKMGSGTAAYLSLNEDAGEVMRKFFERISHPALTDIALDFGGMKVTGMYPSRMPDLFAGQPVVITGRFSGSAASEVHVKGRLGGEDRDYVVNVPAANHSAIGTIWARQKIADLYDAAVISPRDAKELEPEIKKTALEYGLMSAYTSFVAVDSTRKTEGDHGTSVAVPVPVPEGVRYETTVRGGN